VSAWYVVHTHAKSEQVAVENLTRQGFRAYLPRYLKSRKHARRVDTVATPLFPRYVFVNFDVTRTRWRPILSTIGVQYLIMDGEKPLAVPEGVVEEIRVREGDNGMVLMKAEAPFDKGQMVQITGGAMSDLIGLFEGLSDKDRVFVLLDILGRQLRVKVPTGSVAAYL